MIHKAKKSLGQNFLKSKLALETMCRTGSIKKGDMILEIGPGKGVLTTELLLNGANVLAIEKDKDLFEFLKKKFKIEIENKKLKLINDDILKFNPEMFHTGCGTSRASEKLETFKVIANIPYNITGAILKKFLSCDKQPEKMILLVQKEVASRIVARDKKESILSLSVKAYGTPKYIMKVHKRFFSPSPKVDSAILLISNISKDNFRNSTEEKNFFTIVKVGFAHKRKILLKNLEIIHKDVELPYITMEKVFKKMKINPKARARSEERRVGKECRSRWSPYH